jgi:GTPase Era involved in 16S rRNA processing
MGHPNEGKSSVVSTLTENERVRISRTPGETTRSHSYSITRKGEPVLEIIDTPGFQNPETTLAWLQNYSGPESEMIQAFIDAHSSDPAFHHDLELLHPLTRQAGILYVADTSRPLRENDRQEMELLRLTGLPRLALLNRKKENDTYITEWREALNRRFNLVREFNAHRASFAERMDLLTSLSLLIPEQEQTLKSIRNDLIREWQERLHQSVYILEQLVLQAIRHRVKSEVKPDIPDSEQIKKTEERYRNDLRKLEANARREWRQLFHHESLPDQEHSAEEVIQDLFTEKVWRLLGLSRRQIAGAGLTAGATLGAGIDVAAGGITFGVFTLGGALAGGIGSWINGPKLGAKKLPLPGKKTWAKEQIRVGPHADPQLVFVLLDRSLLYITRLMNWAHARRDHEAFLAGISSESRYSRDWTDAQRKAVTRWIKEHARGADPSEESSEVLRKLLFEFLQSHSSSPENGASNEP